MVIMARYKHTDNSQGMFLSVNLQEQLLPDTFEWTIDYLINKIDISSFEQKYKKEFLLFHQLRLYLSANVT